MPLTRTTFLTDPRFISCAIAVFFAGHDDAPWIHGTGRCWPCDTILSIVWADTIAMVCMKWRVKAAWIVFAVVSLFGWWHIGEQVSPGLIEALLNSPLNWLGWGGYFYYAAPVLLVVFHFLIAIVARGDLRPAQRILRAMLGLFIGVSCLFVVAILHESLLGMDNTYYGWETGVFLTSRIVIPFFFWTVLLRHRIPDDSVNEQQLC